MRGKTVYILSVDGGGVRGLFAALLIEDLFRRVRFLEDRAVRSVPGRRRRKRDAGEYVDLITGTSTGALISIALAMPKPLKVEDLPGIYREHGTEIFPRKRFNLLRTVRHAFYDKYDAAPLESVLRGVLGDARLSQCRTNLLIPSYDTEAREPFFFKHRNGNVDEDFYLRDVARATTAAPSYFGPARITSLSGNEYTLVDGGLVANNPAMSGFIEAWKLFPQARRFIVISFGTGYDGRTYPYQEIHKWGFLDWVSPVHGEPLLSMIYDGQTKAVNHYLKKLPNLEYYRFDAPLGAINDEMDDAGEPNMAAIEKVARETIRVQRRELHRLARLLAGYPGIHGRIRSHSSGMRFTGTI